MVGSRRICERSIRLSLGLATVLWAAGPAMAAKPSIAWFGLRAPGHQGHDIEQASGLCFGRLAGREGLWMVCDRNGGQSGGRIYFVNCETLAAAKLGETIITDEEFVIAPPHEGWQAFRDKHSMLSAEVLDHIEQRVAAGAGATDGRRLDLEAVTIGRSAEAPEQDRLFVAAEEPYSLVLELVVGDRTSDRGTNHQSGQERTIPSQATLVVTYRYHEAEHERGLDANDGLEGLAYAGSPGEFWWAEEGTRLHKPDAHPRLFFSHPRVGMARLHAGKVDVDERLSDEITAAIRRHRDGDAQTLNALTTTGGGLILAVDRNGGWILQIDPRNLTASRWLNLYNVSGQNLRELLADFPGERRMPYISIEGIAVDDRGDLWLVDDPAMPEAFRASCLVRISGLPALARLDSGDEGATETISRPTQPAGTSPAGH
jgi:hypothetical protein